MISPKRRTIWLALPLTIVLDAGHGGSDTGIQREGLIEKNLTLQIALQIASTLNTREEIRTVLTRNGDYNLSQRERARVANEHPDALFLSLHFGAAPGSDLHGPRIYLQPTSTRLDATTILPIEQTQAPHAETARRWAEALAFPIETSPYPLVPLLGVLPAGVLLEPDVLTSPQSQIWREEATMKEIVNRIISAIDRFRGSAENPPP